jgi:hypothetical protein
LQDSVARRSDRRTIETVFFQQAPDIGQSALQFVGGIELTQLQLEEFAICGSVGFLTASTLTLPTKLGLLTKVISLLPSGKGRTRLSGPQTPRPEQDAQAVLQSPSIEYFAFVQRERVAQYFLV